MVTANLHEIAPHATCLYQALELAACKLVVKERIAAVPFVYNPPPRCPAPDGAHRGKEIAVGYAGCHLVDIEAGHHGYPVIMLIAVEHLLAEWEERLAWLVVILKHDALVDYREGPFLRYVFRRVAAHVLFLVHTVNVTLPVYLLCNGTAFRYSLQVFVRPGAILIEEQPGGSCLAHLIEDKAECGRTVEEEQQHGYVYFGWM